MYSRPLFVIIYTAVWMQHDAADFAEVSMVCVLLVLSTFEVLMPRWTRSCVSMWCKEMKYPMMRGAEGNICPIWWRSAQRSAQRCLEPKDLWCSVSWRPNVGLPGNCLAAVSKAFRIKLLQLLCRHVLVISAVVMPYLFVNLFHLTYRKLNQVA